MILSKDYLLTPADTFDVPRGMSLAIWQDKYARKKSDGTYQTWAERLTEVVNGNFSLDPREFQAYSNEYWATLNLAVKGVMPFSGRHLQHGDTNQKNKIGEVFTNCSTAMFSFLKFWLLLKGSGVGRCYDNDICFVNWDYLPNTRFVISQSHPDYNPKYNIETLEEATQKYDNDSEFVRWFTVDDSVEGWAKVVEVLETAAFHKNNQDNLFIFDFTKIRPFGAPIWNQQGRPSSGPIPFIQALQQLTTVKGAGWKPWKQALYIDHYLSSCVVVGGIRRSARIAVKSWRDKDIFEFIDAKRGGWLYTANNSILVDKEFWEQASNPKPSHARRVFEYAVSASYYDQTGEPGFINIDLLTDNREGINDINESNYLDPNFKKMDFHPRTMSMLGYMLRKVKSKKYPYIVNPCGEIVLSCYGGYCVIGDICLSRIDSLDEALDAAYLMPRFLIRTNLMKFLYDYEVKRTNRIGVSLTGIHEFAYKMFNITFDEYADKDSPKVKSFSDFMSAMRKIVEASAIDYAKQLKVNIPHTFTCIKPSGTVSKVMNCTEGAHLPAMAYYMRWVQFPKHSSSIKELTDRGYPMKDISHQYKDHVVIGFPTRMDIATLMGDKVVTAGQASPEAQYNWIRILEESWLGGYNKNNQISYTLKYDPKIISRDMYMDILLKYQSTVKACALMPQEDTSAYAYLPEEAITHEEYDSYISKIDLLNKESYDNDTLMCESGACPIETNIN